MIVIVALLSVGLTAPASGPFTIDAIGLDVRVKFGSLHFHYKWTAIPLAPATTKMPGTLL
jgi:hypothetical protein